MNIEPHEISVRELTEGFSDDGDGGVRGYGGKLDIRPAFQREFVYDDKDRAAVIDTASKGYPLNVMYWAVREDGTYEVIDGQQRTISLAQYVAGEFALPIFGTKDKRYFGNLQPDEKKKILDYKATVYFCSGTESDRLAWFETINIAGKVLTKQELRNAVYSGPWVSEAKRHFSKRGGPASAIANNLMKGEAIRQEYLETAISWINDGDVVGYMGTHQHDTTANELWLYYQGVIAWVRSTFPTWRSTMKGLPWGDYYNRFGKTSLDPAALEVRVKALMEDEEVQRPSGIYAYVLDNDERHLGLRAFPDKDKIAAYERQAGICVVCGKHFEYAEMAGDHIVAWSKGGKTVPGNCQMLCAFDNGSKGNK
jgi:hypothetical protein